MRKFEIIRIDNNNCIGMLEREILQVKEAQGLLQYF